MGHLILRRSLISRIQPSIGITVRTNYDLENLKGQGFIYISSDQGEKAYDNPGHSIGWGLKNFALCLDARIRPSFWITSYGYRFDGRSVFKSDS